MKILVADDSKTTRTLLAMSLKKLGHEVIPAVNGQEAVDLFKLQRPDLVILDVIMDGVDGFECARRIRAMDADDWVPIIFLSGAIDDENIERGINAGGDDYLTKPHSEMRLMAKIKAMQRISDMRQKLYEATKKLSALSSTDSLTGLYNRLQFDKSLKEKISHANRYKKMLALMFVDLDNFKTVNDSLGHHTGDLLLKEVALRLKSCLRADDFVARIGGDEFAIILSEIIDKSVIEEIAQKIIKTISNRYELLGNNVQVGASIGIACYVNGENDKSLIQNADIAMYHAKELGRNNFQHFTDNLNNCYKKKLDLENALKTALLNNEFDINYQPIYDLKKNKIVRLEALICWRHPSFGVVLPETFIPLAEEMGLIEEMGTWIIRGVCKQVAKWYASGYKDYKVSINVSPRQLLQKNLPETIKNIIHETQVNPKLIDLEITESSMLIYSQLAEDILQKIHDLGIQIILDDFGTGYSSLTHLKFLPVSAIKIDKSFIGDIHVNSNNTMIVNALIALGKSLKFDVIAEGIENQQQLDFLIKNDCPKGQGYFFSKPLQAEEITRLLDNQYVASNEKAE